MKHVSRMFVCLVTAMTLHQRHYNAYACICNSLLIKSTRILKVSSTSRKGLMSAHSSSECSVFRLRGGEKNGRIESVERENVFLESERNLPIPCEKKSFVWTFALRLIRFAFRRTISIMPPAVLSGFEFCVKWWGSCCREMSAFFTKTAKLAIKGALIRESEGHWGLIKWAKREWDREESSAGGLFPGLESSEVNRRRRPLPALAPDRVAAGAGSPRVCAIEARRAPVAAASAPRAASDASGSAWPDGSKARARAATLKFLFPKILG